MWSIGGRLRRQSQNQRILVQIVACIGQVESRSQQPQQPHVCGTRTPSSKNSSPNSWFPPSRSHFPEDSEDDVNHSSRRPSTMANSDQHSYSDVLSMAQLAKNHRHDLGLQIHKPSTRGETHFDLLLQMDWRTGPCQFPRTWNPQQELLLGTCHWSKFSIADCFGRRNQTCVNSRWEQCCIPLVPELLLSNWWKFDTRLHHQRSIRTTEHQHDHPHEKILADEPQTLHLSWNRQESTTDSLQSSARWRGRRIYSFSLFRHYPRPRSEMVGKKSPCGYNGLRSLDSSSFIYHFYQQLSMDGTKLSCNYDETIRFAQFASFLNTTTLDTTTRYQKSACRSCCIAGAKLRTPHYFNTE